MPVELNPQEETLQYFHYIPNLPAAIVAFIVFVSFATYLSIQIYRSKSPKFLYILPATALSEAIGFVLRIACHNGSTLMKYIIMTLFLLLPPNALALVNYKCVGEIIRLSEVKSTRFYLQPKFVTWFFFSSDVLAFFLQGGGGGLQSVSSSSLANVGKSVTLFGLSIQLIFFACFGFVTYTVARNPDYNYSIEGRPDAKKKLILCLLSTLILLYIRSVYRVIEYATGYAGPVASTEWAFYVFDTIAIVSSFAIYSVYFIGDYLPKYSSLSGDSSIHLAGYKSSSQLPR